MEIVGYATIKKDATTCKGSDHPEKYLGKDVRVFEFDQWGGVLALAPDGTEVAMFDKEDVIRKFECRVVGEYIVPKNLDPLGQMAYTFKVSQRKGGYNRILRSMIIEASLAKGEFYDHFLWQKQ